MPWNPTEFNENLGKAADIFDRVEATELCGGLIQYLLSTDEAYPPKEAAASMQILRRKRWFTLARKVGDAFIQTGRDSRKLRRLYAQALIDQGELTAALSILHDLVCGRRSEDDKAEIDEARGLIGRVHKQMYVNTVGHQTLQRREHLRTAVAAYLDVYATDPEGRLWHGINGVALLSRAERDQVDCKYLLPARALASQILEAVKARGEKAEAWDLATAMEASVALDAPEAVAFWLGRYVAKD